MEQLVENLKDPIWKAARMERTRRDNEKRQLKKAARAAEKDQEWQAYQARRLFEMGLQKEHSAVWSDTMEAEWQRLQAASVEIAKDEDYYQRTGEDPREDLKKLAEIEHAEFRRRHPEVVVEYEAFEGWNPVYQSDEAVEDKRAPPRGRRLKWFSAYLDEPAIEYWDADKLFPKIDEGITILILGRRGSHKTGVMSTMVLDAIFNNGLKATYVPCEDQQFYRQQRVPAYCQARGITVHDLDNRYAVYEDGINLTNKDAVDDFIQENLEFDPDIVVIDTLRQAAAGIGDMSSSQMGDLLSQSGPVRKIRKGLNCIVILLCHPPKNNSSTVSGSGGIEDNSDMIIECEYTDREEGVITATITRHKNGPEGTRFFYKVEPTEVPVPTRIEITPQTRQFGAVPHDPDIEFAALIRHALAEDDIHTYSGGLTNQPMAQRLCPRGAEETEQAWLDRVKTMRKRLSNIQQKQVATDKFSYFDDLTGWCEDEDMADPGDKRYWKWWDHPRQTVKPSLEINRIMESVSGVSPNSLSR